MCNNITKSNVAQFFFAATVLALSVILIKDFGPGKAPAMDGYAAFCGGAGLLVNLIGISAIFFEPLQGVIMLCLDGLAAFFTLAGGVVRFPMTASNPDILIHTQAIAAVIKVGSCSDCQFVAVRDNRYYFSGYASQEAFRPAYIVDYSQKKTLDNIKYRCRMTQADVAIVWFLFATFAATSALHFTSKRGRGNSIV